MKLQFVVCLPLFITNAVSALHAIIIKITCSTNLFDEHPVAHSVGCIRGFAVMNIKGETLNYNLSIT